MNTRSTKSERRERRRIRVRARISGTTERPRLNVFRGLVTMYAQLIDDTTSTTLVAIHSKTGVKKGDAGDRKGKTATAYLLGRALAEAAKTKQISSVVFDRAGYAYHGRVKALLEGVRDGGITC